MTSVHCRVILFAVSLFAWSAATVAGVIVYFTNKDTIDKVLQNHPPGSVIPIYLLYKAVVLVFGWISIGRLTRPRLFIHVYSMFPIILFSVVMMGCPVRMIGYLLTLAEGIHMGIVYSVIQKIELPERKLSDVKDTSAFLAVKGTPVSVNGSPV